MRAASTMETQPRSSRLTQCDEILQFEQRRGRLAIREGLDRNRRRFDIEKWAMG